MQEDVFWYENITRDYQHLKKRCGSNYVKPKLIHSQQIRGLMSIHCKEVVNLIMPLTTSKIETILHAAILLNV